MDALTPQQRQRHSELAKRLRPLVVEFIELANGYAVEIRSADDVESPIREFMALELLCCPFFDLILENKEAGDPQRAHVLKITGQGDIKPFIRAEFGIPDHGNAS